MGYSYRKGYSGEMECAEYLQKLYPSDIVIRFGGVELRKMSNHGDVGIVNSAKIGREIKRAKRDITQSPLFNVFIEVKNQAKTDVWGSYDKAIDDAEMVGKRMVLLYAIKQERGNGKGKRLICMRPETLTYLLQTFNN